MLLSDMVDNSINLFKPISGWFIRSGQIRQVFSSTSEAPFELFCGYLHPSPHDVTQPPIWLVSLSSGKRRQGVQEHFARRPSSVRFPCGHGWGPLTIPLR
ncbi:MAG: hypothetical protein ACXVAV_06795 [Ktedonobacteraceae bacterium]